MATTTRALRAAQRANNIPLNSENPDPSLLPAKLSRPHPPAAPKRALGDITNFAPPQQQQDSHDHHQQQQQPHPYKPAAAVAAAAAAARLRRGPVAKLAKNPSSNSAAARRAKAAAIISAAKKSASPMSTSSVPPRRVSGRLAKRAAVEAAAAAAVQCKLDFAAISIDDSLADLHHPPSVFHTVQLPPGVIDIDADDYDDELANAVYALDSHATYLRTEIKFMADPEYMARQADITIKMRAILVDWLVDVHEKFKLLPQTLHLTINIIDRFLAVKPVLRKKLQLVGVTAMFIASKYEEIYAPEVADYVYISDRAYKREEILAMEAVILNDLKFDVTVPSSLTFLQRCLKAARVDIGCEVENHRHVSNYLVELSLQDSAMLKYRPSVRAAAAVNLAAKLCYIPLVWSPTMCFCSGGWTKEDLRECESEMYRLLEHERDLAGTNKLTAIKRKFGVSKYAGVSRMLSEEPTAFRPTRMEICQGE